MFVGDVTTGRFIPPAVRGRLGIPFLLLLAAPYLPFALGPGMAITSVAATLLISGSRQRPEVSTPQQKQPEVNSL
ncbi:hypothetical protein [Streptomyces sp. NPDC058086]|uniref:hypothetical protein n=1 Tax=Streptomyces sp. NPDC058086 TaxID=3346334 RepID=UPI0036DFAD5E